MISIHVQKKCDFSAAKAWALLSDFGNLSWAPGMGQVTTEGSGVGMLRKIAVPGGLAVESLDSLDHAAMSLSYSVIEGNPMPVSDLRGSISVQALASDRCVIDWQASVTSTTIGDDEARAMLTRFYEKTLEIVSRHLSEVSS